MILEGLVVYLVVAALSALASWLAREETVRLLKREVERAQKAEAVATDRLVHAWREGAVVPARPSPPLPPQDPLPGPLAEEVAAWEDPEHRHVLAERMRFELAKGKSIPTILLELDNEHP